MANMYYETGRRKFIQTSGTMAMGFIEIPSISHSDIKNLSFWRGDTWPPTNYQIASGLAAYGHTELDAQIADANVENAIKNGLNEHYDSMSGKPLGVKDYCMASTIATMMLDGLTSKYTLEIKKN